MATFTGFGVPLSITDGDIAAAANITRGKLALWTLANHGLELTSLRKWDALEQILPAAATSTYLGLVTGTYGSGPPQVQTGDCKNTTTTRRGRLLYQLPFYYPAQGQVVIHAQAGMTTTVASNSGATTIAIEAYKLNDDGTLGSQLVATAAQSINSLTFADFAFTLTTSTLSPGDRLDIRVTIVVTDVATGTAVIGTLQALRLYCDARP